MGRPRGQGSERGKQIEGWSRRCTPINADGREALPFVPGTSSRRTVVAPQRRVMTILSSLSSNTLPYRTLRLLDEPGTGSNHL